MEPRFKMDSEMEISNPNYSHSTLHLLVLALKCQHLNAIASAEWEKPQT